MSSKSHQEKKSFYLNRFFSSVVLSSWSLNKHLGCSHISSVGSLGRWQGPVLKEKKFFSLVSSKSRALRNRRRGFIAQNNHPFRLIKMRHCGKPFPMLSKCSQSKASSCKYTAKWSRDLHPCMIYTTEHKITVSKGTPPEVLKLRHLKLFTGNQLTTSTKCLPTHFRQPCGSAKSPSVRSRSHSPSLCIAATIRGTPKFRGIGL